MLKTKYEAFQTLKNFHAWIENQAQSHTGTLCTKNVKTKKNSFEDYLRQHGISHQTLVSYKSQQNGVA